MSITFEDVFYSRNNKYYLKYGEECTICLDKIITKTTAYITECGHKYHKKCVLDYMKIEWMSKNYTGLISCPMCRKSVSDDHLNDNYYSSDALRILDYVSLDIIPQYKLPQFCSNRYDHYLGLNKKCKCCEYFREKGEYIYEF